MMNTKHVAPKPLYIAKNPLVLYKSVIVPSIGWLGSFELAKTVFTKSIGYTKQVAVTPDKLPQIRYLKVSGTSQPKI